MNVKPNRTLDCIGLYCPEPVFRTRLELDKMAVGEVLELFADDPAAEEDIKSLVKRIGYTLLEIKKENGVLIFLIQKRLCWLDGSASPVWDRLEHIVRRCCIFSDRIQPSFPAESPLVRP